MAAAGTVDPVMGGVPGGERGLSAERGEGELAQELAVRRYRQAVASRTLKRMVSSHDASCTGCWALRSEVSLPRFGGSPALRVERVLRNPQAAGNPLCTPRTGRRCSSVVRVPAPSRVSREEALTASKSWVLQAQARTCVGFRAHGPEDASVNDDGRRLWLGEEPGEGEGESGAPGRTPVARRGEIDSPAGCPEGDMVA